jgi:hypothetical protein
MATKSAYRHPRHGVAALFPYAHTRRDAQQGAVAMFSSRMLWPARTIGLAVALFSLAAASTAHAGDNNAFSVLVNDSAGKPLMFQSTVPLKKGDVINIQSFNATTVMIMQVAMCSRDCPHMHLVKTMSLTPYFIGVATHNQNFVVPEDGRVSFWVQQIDGMAMVPLQGPGGWSLQFIDRFASFATPQLFPNTAPLPANAIRNNHKTLQARFYHRTFINVSLADANG